MNVQWNVFFEFGVAPAELILRGTLTYWFIFLLLRFWGRRSVGSLRTAKALLLVLNAAAAQNAMAAECKSVGEGMVLIGTLVFWALFRFTDANKKRARSTPWPYIPLLICNSIMGYPFYTRIGWHRAGRALNSSTEFLSVG